MMKRNLVLPVLLFLLIFGFAGCKKAQGPAAREEQRVLKTFRVTTSEVTTYIEATGSVQADLEGASKILPYLPGTVQKILVKPGDRVNKGDAVVSILSPEVTDTYSAYLGALAQLSQAERIYNLNTQLFEIGAVTKNDLLNSEATKRQLTAVVDGLKSKLGIYGHSIEGNAAAKKLASDTVVIKAPMNGYIADIQTHVGDKVDVSSPLMTIANPSNIVIVANIYDTDVPRVKKGSKVTFYTDVFHNVPFQGIITYVSDVSDQDAKTVKTFIKLLGSTSLFKQNMFLKLMIEDQKKLLPMIPQSAMVYREGKFYVYCPVQGKQKMCELKEIKPYREVSGKNMAVEGLTEGQEIVLSAMELEKP
jgi:membrane fusion protein, heavy metal efflux system